MQAAIRALRYLRGETGSSYPLAAKCVNYFVFRVLINTNIANARGNHVPHGSEFAEKASVATFSANASACGFFFSCFQRKIKPHGLKPVPLKPAPSIWKKSELMRGRLQAAA